MLQNWLLVITIHALHAFVWKNLSKAHSLAILHAIESSLQYITFPFTVPEILDIHKFARILMSESNKQQQDLDTVKDDLGSLKFGFALLQNSNAELSSVAYKQKRHLEEIQESLESRTDKLDMDLDRLQSAKHPCKGTGWKKVVNLDITHNCPSGWTETGYSKRSCGRAGSGDEFDQCYSTTFHIRQEYSQVCGRIRAYQFGGTEAFFNFLRGTNPITSIDEAYVNGVVLLYKTPSSGSEHIWTFAAGRSEDQTSPVSGIQRCPCDMSNPMNPPSFVGANYFCESQNSFFENPGVDLSGFRFYPEDVLWDGEDCLDTSNCCEINHPPYFIRNLGEKTYSDIEAKICLYRNSISRGNLAVEVVELYVQ